MLEISYLNSGTGTGKTLYLVNHIAKKKNDYFIIVAPTIELCDEIGWRLTDAGVAKKEVRIIHHKSAKEFPVDVLKKQVSKTNKRIVITTQASFRDAFREGLGRNCNQWNLIFDEDFSPIVTHELYFTELTIGVLRNAVSYEASQWDGYSRLIPNGHITDAVYRDGRVQDTLLESRVFKNFVNYLYSGNYTTLILTDRLNKIALFDGEEKKGIKLFAVSLISLEVLKNFKSILVSSSCYNHSLSFKLLKQLNVKLKPINLKGDSDLSFDNINIKYFSEKNWSTMLRSTISKNDISMEEEFFMAFEQEVGDREFAYNANISFRKKITKGTLVKSIQGVNTYIEHNVMLYMPSLNATSEMVSFMKPLGLTRTDIDFDRNVLSAYQFVSRGAVRKLNNKPVLMYVSDKRTAMFLRKQFKGSSYSKMGKNLDILYDEDKKVVEIVPNTIKSFMSRVRKRIKNGETIRNDTKLKYNLMVNKYYPTKLYLRLQ